MKLKKLLVQLEYQVLSGTEDVEINHVTDHSKQVQLNDLFVCIRGMVSDGHEFIAEAIAKGASAIVIESKLSMLYDGLHEGITVIAVEDTRYALAEISGAYYNYPAREIPVIGITGTKGKTTISYMIKKILEQAGHKVGLIGTVEIDTGRRVVSAGNTTPESLAIQQYLREMVEAGCQFAVMEVSSQGLKLHRTAGIFFKVGVFTNLGDDHIGVNEHLDQAEYKRCKAMLFHQCEIGVGNLDDEAFDEIVGQAPCRKITFGCGADVDVRASDIGLISGNGLLGVSYKVCSKECFPVEVHIPGTFSVYNSLAAVTVCAGFGIKPEIMQEALLTTQVKGRVELIPVSEEFTVMIDYAHNAMSLKSLLVTLRTYQPSRLIVVFGCGGNRSPVRRYEMGEVAGRLADFTIVTSDNPRYEEPLAIMKDIRIGISKTNGAYLEICDRKEAIRYALTHAQKGDVIVLAGKGHEDYQEIEGVKYPMDERVLIADIIEEECGQLTCCRE